MVDMNKFYENTIKDTPNELTREFINLKVSPETAIDLGCGAGRDTVFLIKNGWNVIGIDRKDTSKIISSQLTNEELNQFTFSLQNFETIEIPKTNLIIANFSLPFCSGEYFYGLWNKIKDAIVKDGYFVGNLFGTNDSWCNIKENMTFLRKVEIVELFINFNIIMFNEIEEDGKTAMGENKHWHLFNIIARKWQ